MKYQQQQKQRHTSPQPSQQTTLHINDYSTSTQEGSSSSSNSIIEFLNQEQKCLNTTTVDNENSEEIDVDSIFEEINRLSDESDGRSVEEILREAELLLSKQEQIESDLHCNGDGHRGDVTTTTNDTNSVSVIGQGGVNGGGVCNLFKRWNFDEQLKTISEESTPREMKSQSSEGHAHVVLTHNVDDDDHDYDDPELETNKKEKCRSIRKTSTSSKNSNTNRKAKSKSIDLSRCPSPATPTKYIASDPKPSDCPTNNTCSVTTNSTPTNTETLLSLNKNQFSARPLNKDALDLPEENVNDADHGAASFPLLSKSRSNASSIAMLASPTTPASVTASNSFSWTRERALEQQIETLRETLMDTEERLQSLRLQYDNVSQMHRSLRDTNHHMQEEMERLKIDAQHLRECANILRTELQTARRDRSEALEVQMMLQRELDTSRMEKRRACEEVESSGRQILDLQRQCKEMERILMRKNPDSIQGLIGMVGGGSKKMATEQAAGRRMLEQRIAQLESDAKEQDRKAQIILANVQSRFSSVQSKYETHISDLETQVLSLQQINQILNEKIEAYAKSKSGNKNCLVDQESCGTQTDLDAGKLSCITANVFTQTDLKGAQINLATSKTTSVTATAKKMPSNQNGTSAKEETHLLATLRGMRVDLAIKEKAMQRLTRELDECKKTMKKIQKERDAARAEKTNRKPYDPAQFSESTSTDAVQLQESQQKIKLLESDYKMLHDKRLQDLKTLQTAHERELAANKETVRLLEQRLAERDEAFAIIQKHNKIPIDYFALKAKVSSLERRHTEREQRLHILVEALSKGRLSGTAFNEQRLSEGA